MDRQWKQGTKEGRKTKEEMERNWKLSSRDFKPGGESVLFGPHPSGA